MLFGLGNSLLYETDLTEKNLLCFKTAPSECIWRMLRQAASSEEGRIVDMQFG